MGKRGNGEGTIYYSENLKRWVGQYTFDNRRKSVYGKTRTEVKNKLNKILTKIVDKKYIDKSDITLLDLIEMNITEQFDSNKISECTLVRQNETKKLLQENTDLVKISVQKITQIKINKELLKLTTYSNSTIGKAVQMIKKAFNKAIMLNLVSFNPFSIKDMIIIPKSIKQDKTIESLTIDEQKLFVKELEERYDKYTDIFYIALYTGLRIGEILALSKNDIDVKNNLIYVRNTLTKNKSGKVILGDTTKTKQSTRTVPLTVLVKDILINLKKENLLFLDDNKIINPSTVNAHFKKICKNAEIKVVTIKKKKGEKEVNLKTSTVNTHMLRHTFATRCIESGMSAVVLSKLLGHKDITITLNTYTSVFNQFKEDEVQKYLDYMSQLH